MGGVVMPVLFVYRTCPREEKLSAETNNQGRMPLASNKTLSPKQYNFFKSTVATTSNQREREIELLRQSR